MPGGVALGTRKLGCLAGLSRGRSTTTSVGASGRYPLSRPSGVGPVKSLGAGFQITLYASPVRTLSPASATAGDVQLHGPCAPAAAAPGESSDAADTTRTTASQPSTARP